MAFTSRHDDSPQHRNILSNTKQVVTLHCSAYTSVINAKWQRAHVLLVSVKIRKNREGSEEPINTCFPLKLRNVLHECF